MGGGRRAMNPGAIQEKAKSAKELKEEAEFQSKYGMTKEEWNHHLKTFTYPEYVPTNGIVNVMKAIDNKDYTHIHEAIKEGRDVNIPNQAGAHPLELAAWKGDQTLIDILLDAGADVKLCKFEHYFRIQNVK